MPVFMWKVNLKLYCFFDVLDDDYGVDSFEDYE